METSLSERYLDNLHTLYDLNNNSDIWKTLEFLDIDETDNEKTIWF